MTLAGHLEPLFSDFDKLMYYPPPGLIVPLSAGKRGTIIQGGVW